MELGQVELGQVKLVAPIRCWEEVVSKVVKGGAQKRDVG